MYLQKEKTEKKKNIFFVGVLKLPDEKSRIRIQNRIRIRSRVCIRIWIH